MALNSCPRGGLDLATSVTESSEPERLLIDTARQCLIRRQVPSSYTNNLLHLRQLKIRTLDLRRWAGTRDSVENHFRITNFTLKG
jgi:hypothetical protein